MGVDSWDIYRDARRWPGGNSIIAHPPCRGWGRLRGFARPVEGEMALGIYAVIQVRNWGGVLEHPRVTGLWKCMGLPLGNQIDGFGGYSLCVDQHWWGHRAKKNTLLYIVGCRQKDLPPIPLSLDAIEYVVDSGKNVKRKYISRKERDGTPEAFATWLIRVAECCNEKRLLTELDLK